MAFCHPDGGNDRHFAFHAIEHRHNRGAHHAGVGQAQRIRIHVWQMFHQTDHVIAEETEETGRGLWQVIRQIDFAFRNQAAEVVERITVLILEGLRIKPRLTVDPALLVVTLPDQIGFHADNGIAPADLTAGYGFQHEGVFLGTGQFQHQGHRRVEVRRETRIDHLVFTGVVSLFEGVKGRNKSQFVRPYCSCACTAARAP